MSKPVLYIDVDGVLLGTYGDPPAFQLRPGVNSFLLWAAHYFEARFLTAWREEDLRQLLYQLGAAGAERIKYIEWNREKTESIEWARDWYWIEDKLSTEETRVLTERGMTHRYIFVRPKGEAELAITKRKLEEVLQRLGYFTG